MSADREAAAARLNAALWAIPAAREGRPLLRDRVPLSGDRLAARAGRFLTLAGEYAARETFARNMARPPANRFPVWCRPTTQRRPLPCESGPDLLPGMAEWMARYCAGRAINDARA